MRVAARLSCPLYESFRVRQVLGMFDLPAEPHSIELDVEVPGLDEEWSIGMIVGLSGSGKSTIARHAYGDALSVDEPWPTDRAVIDCLGDHPTRTVAHVMAAVGFNSPRSWIKPYRVLSTGEQFRCNLARALLREGPLVVFDEYGSCVDRATACVSSVALAKAIRSGRIAKRFVAVTNRSELTRWLEPDWVLDMASGKLARGRLQRPRIELEVFRCQRSAWELFRPHHYLSSTIHKASRCYLATWRHEPVAFAAVIPMAGHIGVDRLSRVVVLPQFQGIGCGVRLASTIGKHTSRHGRELKCIMGHPGMIAALLKSPDWIATHYYPVGTSRGDGKRHAVGRTVVSFQYVG